MLKGRSSSVVPVEVHQRSTLGAGGKGENQKKSSSGLPIRLSKNVPGRNLARPIGSILEDRAVQKETSGKGTSNGLGFLRPTLSSMAKNRGQVQHDSSRSNDESSTNKSPIRSIDHVVIEMTQEDTRKADEKKSMTMVAEDESRKLKPINHSSPFTIYEANDNDAFVSPLLHPQDGRRPTILSTPKYPRTRSLEKHTKRRLQFRPHMRPQYSTERLRNTSSPPPDFDVTINAAVSSPSHLPPAASYEKFSTPIVNLTSALTLSDEENETVYYTPCAEF